MVRKGKGAKIIRKQLEAKLKSAADRAMSAVQTHDGFTGNLATGSIASVFIDGSAVYTADTQNVGTPVRKKIKREDGFVFLSNPFSGRNRGMKAHIDTDGGYAHSSAMNQAKTTPKGSKYLLRIANGTEYMKFAAENYGYKTLYDILPITASFFK